MGKPAICICENKDADQLRGNRESDQRLFFATRIVQFLYFLNPKFPVSSYLLCLYRPVCVGPVRKPHCWFSHEAAHLKSLYTLPMVERPKTGFLVMHHSSYFSATHLGDNCIQIFHMGRYIVGYTVGNFVLRRRVSGAVKHDFRPYIRRYTTPNEKFEYCYPHSNVLFNYKHRKMLCFLRNVSVTSDV